MRAAYFSDFTDRLEQEKARAKHIKEKVGAKQLFGVMSGNYLQDGSLAEEEKEVRAKRALAADVDLVLEQSVYASLSSLGIYAFSGARILDKLKCVDILVLETEDASLKQLTEISFLLIANPREFQQRVGYYKEKGIPFYQAQAKAIGEVVEHGQKMMESWYNIFAVECIKSLKLMYSSIACVCIPRDGRPPGGLDACKRFGQGRLSKFLEYQLYFQEPQLSDIYGGYEELTNRILRRRGDFQDFDQFSKLIAGTEKDLFDVRKYFLRLLCGMTKSTISIWRMYDFSPYCKGYPKNGNLPEGLKNGGEGFLLTGQGGQEILGMERSKRDLLQLEVRAEQLYRLQRK